MRYCWMLLVVASVILAGCGETVQSTAAPPTTSSLEAHNARYCEIIPVMRRGVKLVASVYNTLGLNDCPAEQWATINAAELEQSLGAVRVIINGPRYWVLDEIQGGGASATGETQTFGGIPMTLRATLEFGLNQPAVGDQLYTPNTVQRTTNYLYKRGTQVYELTDPDGAVYIMQSYAQIDDPNLTLAQLPNLGTRLKLPTGWSYQVRTLDADFLLRTTGTAYVVNDDLHNSYQRRTP